MQQGRLMPRYARQLADVVRPPLVQRRDDAQPVRIVERRQHGQQAVAGRWCIYVCHVSTLSDIC